MIRTKYPNPIRSAAATPVSPVQITPSTLPVRPVLTEQCPKYIYILQATATRLFFYSINLGVNSKK